MTEAKFLALVGFLGFSTIAGLTWFFSYYPRMFMRVFLSREKALQNRDQFRQLLRAQGDPGWGQSMRFIACLQFAMGAIVGLTCYWFQRS